MLVKEKTHLGTANVKDKLTSLSSLTQIAKELLAMEKALIFETFKTLPARRGGARL